MIINEELIGDIAHLARLEIHSSEQEDILADLNKILTFMDKLNELPTEGIQPLVYMGNESDVYRQDEVKIELSTIQALQNAPKHDTEYFRVAKVLNKSA